MAPLAHSDRQDSAALVFPALTSRCPEASAELPVKIWNGMPFPEERPFTQGDFVPLSKTGASWDYQLGRRNRCER